MASNYIPREDGLQRLDDVELATGTEKIADDESELELHRAVFHGDVDGAKAALERGANASIQDRFGVLKHRQMWVTLSRCHWCQRSACTSMPGFCMRKLHVSVLRWDSERIFAANLCVVSNQVQLNWHKR